MSRLRQAVTWCAAAVAWLAGCGPQQPVGLQADPQLARMDARATLLQAAESPDAVVCCHALEAMAFTLGGEAGPIYMEALRQPNVPVRFAAAMSAGDIRYAPAKDLLLGIMQSGQADANLQCAAIYALHRLGEDRYTSRLAEMLFHGPNIEARANAALVMGKMGEPSAVGPLKRFASYKLDRGVELQVHESLAALGDAASLKWLGMTAQFGLLDEKLFAVQALGRARRDRYRPTLVRAFGADEHPLLRVVAAGALARLGDDRGYDLAVQALQNPYKVYEDSYRRFNMLPSVTAEQKYQTQVHAALALGMMGRPEAVDVLLPTLRSDSGAVRVAAAKAILTLLDGGPRAPAATPTPAPSESAAVSPALNDPLLRTAPAKD